MKKKSNWTPSAKTLDKKAETRFRKSLKTVADRLGRLVARSKRMAEQIVSAKAELESVKKSGPKLSAEEQTARNREHAELLSLVKMHDKDKLSFAQIGKKLKISHAWAHSRYRDYKADVKKEGKKVSAKAAPKAPVKSKFVKPAKKIVAKPAKKAAKPAARKAAPKKAVVKKDEPVATAALADGAKWGEQPAA